MKLGNESSAGQPVTTLENLSTDVSTILDQFNSIDPQKRWWVHIENGINQPVLFLRPCVDLVDSAQFLFFRAIGLKGSMHPGIQNLPVAVQKTIRDKNMAKNSIILMIEIGVQGLQKLNTSDFLTPKYSQKIIELAKAYRIIIDILRSNCGNVTAGFSSSGFTLQCTGNRPDIYMIEIISVLCDDLKLQQQGLGLKLIKERTNESETVVHIDFVTFFNSQAVTTILEKSENDKKLSWLSGAIDERARKRMQKFRKGSFQIEIPTMSLCDTLGIKLLKPMEENVCNPRPANIDKIVLKELLIKNFTELMAEVLPGGLWKGVLGADHSITIILRGIDKFKLFEFCKYCDNCSLQSSIVCNSTNGSFLRIDHLELLHPDNKTLWEKVFLNADSVTSLQKRIKKQAEYRVMIEKTRNNLLDFIRSAGYAHVLINCEDNDQGYPLLSISGDPFQVDVDALAAYLTVWNMSAVQDAQSEAIIFTFNKLHVLPLKYYKDCTSEQYVPELRSYKEAISQLPAIFQTGSIDYEYTIIQHTEKILYNFHFFARDTHKHARLFFSYLKYRYPGLVVTCNTSKQDKQSLKVTITMNPEHKATDRGFFDNPEVRRLANDVICILKIIIDEMPALRKKYGFQVPWATVKDDIKVAIAKGLVKAINLDNVRAVHSFFAQGEWDLDELLPVKGRKNAIGYAQEIGSNNVYAYLHGRFTEIVRIAAAPFGVPVTSAPDSIGVDLMRMIKRHIPQAGRERIATQLAEDDPQEVGLVEEDEAVGVALVNAIKEDDVTTVIHIFESKKWNFERALPVNDGLKPIFYAEKCNAPNVLSYFSELFGAALLGVAKDQPPNFLANLTELFLKKSAENVARKSLPQPIEDDSSDALECKSLDSETREKLARAIKMDNVEVVSSIYEKRKSEFQLMPPKDEIRKVTLLAEKCRALKVIEYLRGFIEAIIDEVEKTQIVPQSVKHLKLFCTSAELPSMWELAVRDKLPCAILTHNSDAGIGLLYNYFKEAGLACDWQDKALVISLELLNRWHVEVFTEEKGGVNAIQQEIDTLKKKMAFLHAVLSSVRGIMGVSDWQSTPLGLECLIRTQNKSEDAEHYSAKRHNILMLLEWVWFQCGVAENQAPIEVSEELRLKLGYGSLGHNKLYKLISEEKLPGEKGSLLKTCRQIASIISKVNRKLSSIKAIDEMIAEDKKSRASANYQHPKVNEDEGVKKKTTDKKPKSEKSNKSDKSHRSGKSSKNSLLNKGAVNATTDVVQGKKKAKKAEGPRIAPQNPQRLESIDKIRSVEYKGSSTVAGGGIDLRQFAPLITEPKSVAAVEVVQALPVELGSEDQRILQQLDDLFIELSCVIAAYNDYTKTLNPDIALSDTQQSELMSYVAAWHYQHAQITNILAMLKDDHPVKRHLFNQNLYSGRRTYDRQKHEHIPPMCFGLSSPTLQDLPTNRCFQDISSVQAALSLLSEKHYPLQESITLANIVIKSWASYIEADFDRYNLAKLTAAMDQQAFVQWLHDTMRNYTQRIRQLLSMLGNDGGEHDNNLLVNAEYKNRQFSLAMAIRFYVTRIGELVGHLPPSSRTSYLKFCRHFRNAAAHPYSRSDSVLHFEEPILDLAKLAVELCANTSPRFFAATDVIGAASKESSEGQQPIWPLYVNKTYQYQQKEVLLLVQLRLQEISKRLEKPVAINVCDLVQLTPKTNFYSCLAGQIQQLDKQVSATEGSYGLLLIPLNCFQTQDDLRSDDIGASPCAMAMKFVRQVKSSEKGSVGNLFLKEICYAPILNAPVVKSCMELMPRFWAENSPQKSTSTIKLYDSIVLDLRQKSAAGVLQVELLTQLAERRLIADSLLKPVHQSKLPLSKKQPRNAAEAARQAEDMIQTLRMLHLEQTWRCEHHECYFRQQLIKSNETYLAESPANTDESVYLVAQCESLSI